jgi:LmeA-like phospholipid-binding
VTTEYGYTGYEDTAPVRARRRRPWRTVIIVLIVLLGLLIAADFAARAFAQNKMASEIQQQGFPKKPDVSINGFPFLTQVISRDFKDIHVSSTNITEGPLLIQSINATMTGVHVNSSFQSGTVDHLNGTMTVTFPALANAMTSQAGALGSLVSSGLTLSDAGNNEVKASLDLLGGLASGTAVWRVTRTGHNEIHVHLVSATGLGSAATSGISDITVPLPALPLGMTIQSIAVTPTGLVAVVTGQNVSFGS